MAKSDKIRMYSPDGRPWDAENEAEAMQLGARGYKREDGEKKAVPSSGAKTAPAGKADNSPA